MENINFHKDNFPKKVGLHFEQMGTIIGVQIIIDSILQEKRVKKDIEEIRDLYEKYANIFSRFEKESELFELNLNLNKWQKASVEILEIAEKCLEYNKETDGYFDPRIIDALERAGYDADFDKIDFSKINKKISFEKNKRALAEDLKTKNGKVFFSCKMDFSGIVKGWVADKAADFLIRRGWKNFLIDSGGDMYFSGTDENGKKWTVDIEGVALEKLKLAFSDEATATSGIAKRKWETKAGRAHHLINPGDPGRFSFELRSVTVTAELVEKADVWAKTLFLMGKEKGSVYSKENGIKSLFLDYNGNAWISQSFLKHKI